MGSNTFRVTVGEFSTYSFTVTDESEGVQVQVEGPAEDTYFLNVTNNNYEFNWALIETSSVSVVTFVATDTLGVSSILSPRVEVCACRNGGNCTTNGILGIDSNAVIMRCECSLGKILIQH